MTKARNQNPTIDKVIPTIIVVLYTLFLLSGYCFAEGQADKDKNQSTKLNVSSNVQYLTFSSTQYSHERNLVRKHERIKSRAGKIYIALVDLNNDGTKEIISYIHVFEYCGQETGCPLNIYRIINGKLISLLKPIFNDGFPMFIEIDKTGKQNVIGVLSNTNMGWHDLLINGETVWKWHGKYYGYKI